MIKKDEKHARLTPVFALVSAHNRVQNFAFLNSIIHRKSSTNATILHKKLN